MKFFHLNNMLSITFPLIKVNLSEQKYILCLFVDESSQKLTNFPISALISLL